MKFSPLTNFEISDMMAGIDFFNGVFTRDTLPSSIKEKECGVINYDKIDGNGTHWVAYFNCPCKEHVLFFDSFGLPPGSEIQKFLKTSKKQIQFNSSEIQEMASIMCGYYCVYVLKELSKGGDFFDIIQEFDTEPTERNEALIKSKFK